MGRTTLAGSIPAFLLLGALGYGCSGATSTPPPDTMTDSGTTTGDGGGNGPDGSNPDGGTTPHPDGSTTHPDGSTPAPPPMTSAVQIIVEPSDDAAALIGAIQGAKTSVHMTMYLLSNSSVINALIAQQNAGHDVKVLLNQTFPNGAGSNASAYSQLQSAGVNVKWAPSGFLLTHEKAILIDAKVAWIMTMNATQSSARDNREYLAIDSDPNDVAEAEGIFQADFLNQSHFVTGNLVVAPDNARAKLKALIDSATTTIDMEAEELSDTTVSNALAAAADRGVKVRAVIANTTLTTSQQTAVALLKQHGAKLVTLASPYIHAKSIVADGVRAYVGSENFSAGSLGSNRELGVLTDAAAEVAKIASATATDFGHGTAL